VWDALLAHPLSLYLPPPLGLLRLLCPLPYTRLASFSYLYSNQSPLSPSLCWPLQFKRVCFYFLVYHHLVNPGKLVLIDVIPATLTAVGILLTNPLEPRAPPHPPTSGDHVVPHGAPPPPTSGDHVAPHGDPPAAPAYRLNPGQRQHRVQNTAGHLPAQKDRLVGSLAQG
jgi:hypothetical protein